MSYGLDGQTGISPFDSKLEAINGVSNGFKSNGKSEHHHHKMMSAHGSQNYLDFLKPLYAVLNVAGLLLPKSSATGTERFTKDEAAKGSTMKKMGFRNWLIIVFAYIYLLHSFISATMVGGGKMTFLKWSAVIQRIIESMVAVFSLNHFLTSQSDIYAIFGSCIRYIGQLPPIEVTRLKNKCRRVVFFIILGFVLGFAVLPDSLKDSDFYVQSSFYGLNSSQELTSEQSLWIVAVDFSLRNILDSISLILMFAFVSVSYYIGASAKFYELKLIETKDSSVVTPEALHQVQKYHGEITDLCQRTDAIFTRITLAWYFDLVQRFLLLIPAILTSVKSDPFYVYFGLSIQFLYYSYVFTVMSLSASKVKEVSHDGMLTVHRIANKIPSSDWHSLNLIVNLMGMMSTSQMHLTAWNFFIIDRSLILTVLSMVLTYTVVVIQFFSV